MNYKELYDEYSPESIEKYAKNMINQTFRDLLSRSFSDSKSTSEYIDYYESIPAKGSLGHLIELEYFGLKKSSKSEPDFNKAGVELKLTPYKYNKNKTLSAKERLVLTNINYNEVINEDYDHSHLVRKCNLLLLIHYLYEKDLDKLDYTVNYVNLFSIPKEDLDIIKSDYETIVNKIKNGEAHNLSEADTMYLGACTKGATAATSMVAQPNSSIPAKHRAFCYKNSYMTYVLNNYIVPNKTTYEKIQYEGNFEDYISKKVNNEINASVYDLAKKYNLECDKKPAKSFESNLVFRILGLKSNLAEEFIKAGIKVKTIRLEHDEKLKETVSFPPFNFNEMSKEQWEDSYIYNYLSETKFFFIVFKKDVEYDYYRKQNDYVNMHKHIHLYFSTFWNMSNDDIEQEVKAVWKKTKQIINEGIKTKTVNGITYNNLPKIKDNRVCHIRPHAKNKADMLPLPNGDFFTKQSFFLNSNYVRDEILKLKQVCFNSYAKS